LRTKKRTENRSENRGKNKKKKCKKNVELLRYNDVIQRISYSL